MLCKLYGFKETESRLDLIRLSFGFWNYIAVIKVNLIATFWPSDISYVKKMDVVYLEEKQEVKQGFKGQINGRRGWLLSFILRTDLEKWKEKKTQADTMFVSPAVSLGIVSVIKSPWYTQVYAGKKNPGISFWRQLIF